MELYMFNRVTAIHMEMDCEYTSHTGILSLSRKKECKLPHSYFYIVYMLK